VTRGYTLRTLTDCDGGETDMDQRTRTRMGTVPTQLPVTRRAVTFLEEYGRTGLDGRREPVPRLAAVCSAIRHLAVTATVVCGGLCLLTILALLMLALVDIKP
jgi:hypothetical protein